MSQVTYDNERYLVEYWTNSSMLVFNSSVVSGSSDISKSNENYSVVLAGLQAETTYFYKVVAMNGVGANESTTSNFTTPVSGIISKYNTTCYYSPQYF